MSYEQNINIPVEEIAVLCQRHDIRKMSLFGSVLGDDFRTDSDIDVLVEFEPGAVVGLRFVTIQDELSRLLGVLVDLNTEGFLSKYFRQKVSAQAVVIYERTG